MAHGVLIEANEDKSRAINKKLFPGANSAPVQSIPAHKQAKPDDLENWLRRGSSI